MKTILDFCKLLVVTLVVLLLIMQTSSAHFVTGTLIVSARVTDVCVFPTENYLNFGDYDRTLSQATRSIGAMIIMCTRGDVITSIGLNNGQNKGEGLRRAMLGQVSGDKLYYHITQPVNAHFGAKPYPGDCPAGPGTEWTAAGSGLLLPSPNKFYKTTIEKINICGFITPGQDVNTDNNYKDTISITLNYW